MSPLTLRRYRAERLLRAEFEALRERVRRAVQARLRGCGGAPSRCDLEACYAAAWQGLYMATLEGAQIEDPTAWLVLVTFRRALDERRARAGEVLGCAPDFTGAAGELERGVTREMDMAAELDDRRRLRQLFEGLRGRLSEREREAAVLCYLQGLTRAQAAARMGVSEARMRKLMEGHGSGRPGVAGKVGALVASIRDEQWCEEQGSLMRALAFGVLDPHGQRRRLALAHTFECPACRAYVSSLRGLAAALPPALAPWSLAAARLGGSISGTATLAGGPGALGAGSGAGAAAGGGWLLAGGPLTAKLAIGCVLAAGLGAGCALEAGLQPRSHAPRHAGRQGSQSPDLRRAAAAREALAAVAGAYGADAGRRASARAEGGPAGAVALTPATRASREFGLDRTRQAGPSAGAAASSSTTGTPHELARAAAADTAGSGAPGAAGEGRESAAGTDAATASGARAAREFSPG
jgi:DNA-directed RNA polymerase specialized sigma24 family protein